jgi:hypothetical protein
MSAPPSPGYTPNSDEDEDEDDDALGWKIHKPAPRSSARPTQQSISAAVAHGNNGAAMAAAEPSRKRQRVAEGPIIHDDASTSTSAPVPETMGSLGSQQPPPPHMKPHHPLPGLRMKSFFGIQPVDEISDVIGRWLLQVCYGLSNVEVGGIWVSGIPYCRLMCCVD